MAESLVRQRRWERRVDFEDGGLAVDDNWLSVIARKHALAVVRVVELAEAGLLHRTVREFKKMAWCAGWLDRGRRVGAVESLEVLVGLVCAVSGVAVYAAGIAAITLVCRSRRVGLGLWVFGFRILRTLSGLCCSIVYCLLEYTKTQQGLATYPALPHGWTVCCSKLMLAV